MKSAGRKTESPLPDTTVEQIVFDYVRTKGFQSISLKQVCDFNPTIYGASGSKLRRKVQRKVYNIHRKQQTNPLSALSSESSVSQDIMINSPNRHSPNRGTPNRGTPNRGTPTGIFTPSTGTGTASGLSNLGSRQSDAQNGIVLANMHGSRTETVCLPWDEFVDYDVYHGHFEVGRVEKKTIYGGGGVVNGYEICMEVDIADMANNYFKAELTQEQDALLIRAPSTSYLHRKAVYESDSREPSMLARNIAKNKMDANSDSFFVIYRIEFPPFSRSSITPPVLTNLFSKKPTQHKVDMKGGILAAGDSIIHNGVEKIYPNAKGRLVWYVSTGKVKCTEKSEDEENEGMELISESLRGSDGEDSSQALSVESLDWPPSASASPATIQRTDTVMADPTGHMKRNYEDLLQSSNNMQHFIEGQASQTLRNQNEQIVFVGENQDEFIDPDL